MWLSGMGAEPVGRWCGEYINYEQMSSDKGEQSAGKLVYKSADFVTITIMEAING